jgi:ribosomal protein S18 acetylase RimI-like enzyme
MVVFRRMEFRDLMKVQRLNMRAMPESLLLSTFISTLSDSYYTSFISETESEVIGYVEATADRSERAGTIYSVCVDARYRRQGIGRRLIELSLRAIRMTVGDGEVFLYVREDNAGAIRLYESLGFEIVERGISYYEHGALAHRMRLSTCKPTNCPP